MGVWANILEALRNLLSTRQRSALALIGIVIGTGSVVAMISIGGMVRNETMKRFEEMGTDLIAISVRARTEGQELGVNDLPALESGLAPWLNVLTPTISDGMWLESQGQSLYANQIGTTATMQALYGLKLVSGRFISTLDRYQRFGVLGHDMAEHIAKSGHSTAPGATLVVEGQVITLIGVLAPAPRDMFGGTDVNNAIILPIETLSRTSTSTLGSLSARLRPGLTHQAAAAGIRAWFAEHYPAPSPEVRSPEQMIEQMQQQMRLLTLMLGAIGSISLIVGGVGVMNIMLVSVTERRREIGIRLAIGARRRDVRLQFLIEAVILALIGGLLGLLLGAAAWIAAYFFHWSFFVTAPVLLLGFGVSAAVGVFFGFYPAVQASNIDPIVALRA